MSGPVSTTGLLGLGEITGTEGSPLCRGAYESTGEGYFRIVVQGLPRIVLNFLN